MLFVVMQVSTFQQPCTPLQGESVGASAILREYVYSHFPVTTITDFDLNLYSIVNSHLNTAYIKSVLN
jgi:hypothetical protein